MPWPRKSLPLLRAAEAGWGPLRMIGIALPSRVVGQHADTQRDAAGEIFALSSRPPACP